MSKTLIPTSTNTDFFSSLPGPAYKTLERYFRKVHEYDSLSSHRTKYRDFLLNLKYLNHENYDACHRHINMRKIICIHSVADVQKYLKSSYIFEKFAILHLIEFNIDLDDKVDIKNMSKELPLHNKLMDTFSVSKHLLMHILFSDEGYQSVVNNFLIKIGDRHPNVTVKANYPKLKFMEIYPTISELHVSYGSDESELETFKVCAGRNDKIDRGTTIVDSSSFNKLTTLVLGAASTDQLNFFGSLSLI